MDSQVATLNADIANLKQTIMALQTQLEKYTNNERHKKYYEKNKEKVKENAKKYLNNLKEANPDKLKEYRHRAYIKRKEQQQQTTGENTVAA